jgi:hypothetical protein
MLMKVRNLFLNKKAGCRRVKLTDSEKEQVGLRLAGAEIG